MNDATSQTTVSILGCGWLGLNLGRRLLEEGYIVRGSTTTPEKVERLEEEGIDPFLLRLDPEVECESCGRFWEADALVLNIPPGRGRDDVETFFPEQVASVIEALEDAPVRRLIFASSTSVYPARTGVVGEDDARPGEASRASGNAQLEAERMLLEHDGFETSVLRFGGLYGGERHPVRYLAGREGLERGNAPVNLIHRDDAVGIIRHLLSADEEEASGVFNAVCDGHPPRKIYYRRSAEKRGLEPPRFAEDPHSDHTVVSNRKLKERLGYRYAHPDPLGKANGGG